MPGPAELKKTCVICGADCSNKSRIKDTKGRYYCKECHESATRRKPAARIASAPPPPPSFSPESEPLSLLDQLVADAPAVEAVKHCDQCGFALASGAVICTNCGFNLATGRALKPKVLKTRAAAGDGSGAVWPMVVGIISIVFGASGILLTIIQFVSGFADDSGARPASFAFGEFAGAGLTIALSLWLLTAGIGIARKQSAAVASIRRWAIAKASLYTLCLGGLMLLVVVGSSALKSQMNRPGGDEIAMLLDAASIALPLLWLWFMAWPAFVWIWFSRPAIVQQVNQWD